MYKRRTELIRLQHYCREAKLDDLFCYLSLDENGAATWSMALASTLPMCQTSAFLSFSAKQAYNKSSKAAFRWENLNSYPDFTAFSG